MQAPAKRVPGILSPEIKRGRGVTLTTHPYLMPRLRMSRSCTSSPPKCLRGVQWDSFSFILIVIGLFKFVTYDYF
jgi:hypothetical protein